MHSYFEPQLSIHFELYLQELKNKSMKAMHCSIKPKFGFRISKFRTSNGVWLALLWRLFKWSYRLLKSINFVAQFRSSKSAKNLHHYVTKFKPYGGTLKAIIRLVKWGYIWGYKTLSQMATFWPPSHLKNTRVNDILASAILERKMRLFWPA